MLHRCKIEQRESTVGYDRGEAVVGESNCMKRRGKGNLSFAGKERLLIVSGRCTWRAWECWYEHASEQKRMFGVARKAAGRMLHRCAIMSDLRRERQRCVNRDTDV